MNDITTTPASPLRLMAFMGATQILGWATTLYLPAVLASPIAADTGWALGSVVAGLSGALLIAGCSAPRVGRWIDEYGGRPILAAGSLCFAAGLVVMGLAPNLYVYYFAWAVLGVAMALGTYDAAFATLARIYGANARTAMSGLTLIGGFASTVGWPAMAALESALGWRDTCFVLAATHILFGLPIHLLSIPKEARRTATSVHGTDDDNNGLSPAAKRLFILVAAVLTTQFFVMSALSVHVLDILARLGFTIAAALAVGMVIGPAQVAGRLVELWFFRSVHPTWSTRGALLLCLLGVALLIPAASGWAFLAAALYGAGNGILTIVRGTLPLKLFGAEGYGARLGALASPILVAQAAAPLIAAFMLDAIDARMTLIVLCALLLLAFIGSLRLPTDNR